MAVTVGFERERSSYLLISRSRQRITGVVQPGFRLPALGCVPRVVKAALRRYGALAARRRPPRLRRRPTGSRA